MAGRHPGAGDSRGPSSARRVGRAKLSREEQWLFWWSFARHDLGLTSDEFYALTLRQLSALRKRHEQRVGHDEFMLAQLTAYAINFSYRAPKKPVEPRDFMPSQIGKHRSSQAKPRMTRKRRRAIADAFRTFFPRT
jgi:hypothetical protein